MLSLGANGNASPAQTPVLKVDCRCSTSVTASRRYDHVATQEPVNRGGVNSLIIYTFIDNYRG